MRAERKTTTQPPGRRRLDVAPFTEIGVDHWRVATFALKALPSLRVKQTSDKSSSKSQSERRL